MVRIAVIKEINVEHSMIVCGDCQYIKRRQFTVSGSLAGHEYVCGAFDDSTLTWTSPDSDLPPRWSVLRCARCRYAEDDARTLDAIED